MRNRLIINCLPWTHAEYRQLTDRLYRQGQIHNQVDIIVPLTYAEIDGKRWSWCESRWERINFKKSIADAAVDGIIPEGQLPSPAQVFKGSMALLERLERGEIKTIERKNATVESSVYAGNNALRTVSEFVRFNQDINAVSSTETNKRFKSNPDQWYEYHALYRITRKEWEVIPYKEAILYIKLCSDWVVGDFGCGEAFLASELPNIIYSFDHIAINENVIACDMKNVLLNNEVLDIAVFSLSLMGINYIDYLKEANRCLKAHGHLWIAEPTNRISNIETFKLLLNRLGFAVVNIEYKGQFTFLNAIKNNNTINNIALEEVTQQSILS